MPFCPKCKYEYVAGVSKCPDCDVKLVEKLPEEKKPEHIDPELVTVAEYTFDVQAEEARLLLDSHGIPALVENAITSTLYPGMTRVKVSVRQEDAAKAREVLSEQ